MQKKIINQNNRMPNFWRSETINTTEDGEILTQSKEELIKNYIKLKTEKHVKDFKITHVTTWKKSKNPTTRQGSLFG